MLAAKSQKAMERLGKGRLDGGILPWSFTGVWVFKLIFATFYLVTVNYHLRLSDCATRIALCMDEDYLGHVLGVSHFSSMTFAFDWASIGQKNICCGALGSHMSGYTQENVSLEASYCSHPG